MNTNIEHAPFLANFDLARLGLRDVAYVRPLMLDGRSVFSVHSADGREIGIAATMREAVETAHSFDLVPIPVH